MRSDWYFGYGYTGIIDEKNRRIRKLEREIQELKKKLKEAKCDETT